MLARIVDGNPKLPFRKLQHQDVGEGATPFPELFYFIPHPYLIMLSVKQDVSSTIVWVFGMTRPGIEPGPPGHWRTL